MRKFHRNISFLSIIILLVVSLAACKPAAQPTTEPQEDEVFSETEAVDATEEPAALSGSIDFWVYEPDAGKPEAAAALETLKADFEAANPGTTINIVQVPKNDFTTKLNAAIAAKTAPDASYLDQPLVARFALDGVLASMPDGLLDESTLYQGALNTNRVNGTLYGLPLSQTTIALFYNKDLVPDPPTTWDELISVAEAVYDPENQVAAFEVPRGGWAAWIFPAFVATAGGTMLDEENKVVSFGEQPAIDALTLWKTLAEYSPKEITDSQNAFQTGHTAMKLSGPWEIDGLRNDWPDLNWGVTLVPANVANGSNIGGDDAVVYAKSQNPDLAWAWLKFLTDPEPNLLISRDIMGNFPINLADATGSWLNGDEALLLFMEQMKTAQARPTNPDWLQINDEMVATAIDDAIDNGVDPATALQTAAENAKALLGW